MAERARFSPPLQCLTLIADGTATERLQRSLRTGGQKLRGQAISVIGKGTSQTCVTTLSPTHRESEILSILLKLIPDPG